MRGSRSSPGLHSHSTEAATRATLPHRGADNIGLVVGRAGDDVYVPRALWTETFDSPLKKRSLEYDPREHAEDQLKSKLRHGSMQQMLVQELDRQVQHKHTTKQAALVETRDLVRTAVAADLQRVAQAGSLQREAKEESRRLQRAALDEMIQEAQRREKVNAAREVQEAAEIKLRTIQQLTEEMADQARRRKAAERNAREGLSQADEKRRQKLAEQRRETQETRQLLQEDALRAEYQLQAQQERLRMAQEKQDLSYEAFSKTAAREEAARRADEAGRLDASVQQQQMLTDMHYSRREAARDRQRQRMVEVLDQQVDMRRRDKSLVGLQKQMDKEAVDESTRLRFEQDLRRFESKKREEMRLQRELVEMMAEKQQRAKSEGRRPPPALATMEVTPGMLASAKSRASSSGSGKSSPDLHQRMDASRYLQKPCGKPEAKPWVDLEQSHGLGGVVGVFGGDGGITTSLRASGGKGRLLARNMELAERDSHLQKKWHEGLSAAELRVGQQAAAQRGARATRDKGDGPLGCDGSLPERGAPRGRPRLHRRDPAATA